MEARMGRKSVVVAVLLEHSVNMATSRHSRMEMAAGGMVCSGTKLSPSHVERPEVCEASGTVGDRKFPMESEGAGHGGGAHLTSVGQRKASPQKQQDVPGHFLVDDLPVEQRNRSFSGGSWFTGESQTHC